MTQVPPELVGLGLPRDLASDRLHAIMGRALFVATGFEDHVTELAVALGARDRGAAAGDVSPWSESDWRSLVQEIVNRQLHRNIQGIIGPLDSHSARYRFHVLDSARRARNSIVHELPLELAAALQSELARYRLIQAIQSAVEVIASVDFSVLRSLQIVRGVPAVDTDLYSAYCKGVVKWVCDPAPYENTPPNTPLQPTSGTGAPG